MQKVSPLARPVVTTLDPPTRLEGEGETKIPLPSPKGFYFGLQVSLFSDRQGLKFAFKFRLLKVSFERTFILKHNPIWNSGNPELTPKMRSTGMLVRLPKVKQIEPGDV